MKKWTCAVVVFVLAMLVVMIPGGSVARTSTETVAATATYPPRAYLPLVMRNFCVGPHCPPTPTPTPTPAAGQVAVGETVAWREGYTTFVGLVANGTAANVSGVRIAVTLRAADGREVDSFVASVPAWHIQPQSWVCWKAVSFSDWFTYTVRVADYVSGAAAPDVRVVSASLSSGDWPTLTGQVRNAGNTTAHDPQVTAWLRSNGILADCISAILSPNPLQPGHAADFALYASRVLTGTVTLGGTHASGRTP